LGATCGNTGRGVDSGGGSGPVGSAHRGGCAADAGPAWSLRFAVTAFMRLDRERAAGTGGRFTAGPGGVIDLGGATAPLGAACSAAPLGAACSAAPCQFATCRSAAGLHGLNGSRSRRVRVVGPDPSVRRRSSNPSLATDWEPPGEGLCPARGDDLPPRTHQRRLPGSRASGGNGPRPSTHAGDYERF